MNTDHTPTIVGAKNGGTRKVTILRCSCGAKLGRGLGGGVVSNMPPSRGGQRLAEERFAEHLAVVADPS